MTAIADVKLHRAGWQVYHGERYLGLADNLDRAKHIAREHGLGYQVVRDKHNPSITGPRGPYKTKHYCERCGDAKVVNLGLCSPCYTLARRSEFSASIAEKHGCSVSGCQRLGLGAMRACNSHRRQVYVWAKRAGMSMAGFTAWLREYEEDVARRASICGTSCDPK